MSKKDRIGVVYSTNPDYQYQYDLPSEAETLPPAKQRLKISLEKHHRGGKTATIIRGFIGTDEDLQALAKQLKSHCGVGGSAKEGEIIIQGDQQQKVREYLGKEGFRI